MYIKEYTAIIVQARNDKNLNLHIVSRQKEQWEVLKVQLIDFGWKREKSRMPPNSVVLVSGNLVVAEVKVGKIERCISLANREKDKIMSCMEYTDFKVLICPK